MSVKVYILERKLPVESIYVLGFYPKSCVFEKIIKNSILAPNYFVHSLNIICINNCSKLVYTMLWHKSSDIFFLFSNYAQILEKKSIFPNNAIIFPFFKFEGKHFFSHKIGPNSKKKKSVAGHMPEHVVYQFSATFD